MKTKKRKTPAENAAQFARTIKKTGKWRGEKAGQYIKYKKKKRKKLTHSIKTND